MDGVQILNTYQIQSEFSTLVGLGLMLGIIFSIICGIYAIASGKWRLLLVAFVIGIPSYYLGFNVPAEMITRYEVVCDNNVTISYITENYKIIEQRGDIWVLEEKSDNNE